MVEPLFKHSIYLAGHLAAACEARPFYHCCRLPSVCFSSVVRDLGVTLDQELTFAPHINRLCRDSYYQLRQFRTVARSLTSDSTATLIHSFITVRLDYCCSLYVGLPACRLGCLNRVLRSAARLCGHIPKFGHVSGYNYAGCASLAPLTAADLVSDHRLGLAVLAGSSPCLSTRPLLPYLGCSGSSLSPLYWRAHGPFCPHSY